MMLVCITIQLCELFALGVCFNPLPRRSAIVCHRIFTESSLSLCLHRMGVTIIHLWQCFICHYGYRDALLCTILDGVRASGNRDACEDVLYKPWHRLCPFSVAVEEDLESQYLRYFTTNHRECCFLKQWTGLMPI